MRVFQHRGKHGSPAHAIRRFPDHCISSVWPVRHHRCLSGEKFCTARPQTPVRRPRGPHRARDARKARRDSGTLLLSTGYVLSAGKARSLLHQALVGSDLQGYPSRAMKLLSRIRLPVSDPGRCSWRRVLPLALDPGCCVVSSRRGSSQFVIRIFSMPFRLYVVRALACGHRKWRRSTRRCGVFTAMKDFFCILHLPFRAPAL